MVYLDHAGTTLYAKSLIEEFSKQMLSDVFGNPHSASSASQLSTRRIDDVRTRALRFFNADPDHFDLVFLANATAGIKLVMEAFREQTGGFCYGYHKDSHTSLVGAREAARKGHRCYMSDAEVETWLNERVKSTTVDDVDVHSELFAYPAQSNMNGRRLPTDWPARLRSSIPGNKTYSLCDAAGLVSTSPLDLSNPSTAPDFTVLSFYKIFGFPDLGALIVRKECASVFSRRGYFGGGTVEMVTCGKENWHMPKTGSVHERLEDGTLPVHSMLALAAAIDIHATLYGTLRRISRHTNYLARHAYENLKDLRHYNGAKVCEIYVDGTASYNDSGRQGPIVAFNLKTSRGTSISNAEVEKLASVRKIQLRSGGLCNPGGIASSLGLAPWEMRHNFSAGQRCGNENDIMDGKPTGMLRISFGAMSNIQDVEKFLSFLREFFVERERLPLPPLSQALDTSVYYIESLTVYPIKSCGGWSVPEQVPWRVRQEGLAWDREWCIVHQGTRQALNQKKYPKMSLIRPSIDLKNGLLRIRFFGFVPTQTEDEIAVPLSADPTVFQHSSDKSPSQVCGDSVSAHVYKSATISNFLSAALDTPCTLARFPSTTSSAQRIVPSCVRHSKPHLSRRRTGPDPPNQGPRPSRLHPSPLLLSNESPILIISRSSLNRLNENIKRANPNGKAAHASVFRANIVLAEQNPISGLERPYAEDQWSKLRFSGVERTGERTSTSTSTSDNTASNTCEEAETETSGHERQLGLDILGGCRRCQMVCVDQTSAVKDEEPLVTLAKTRRRVGKGVFFGVHAALSSSSSSVIAVGDRARPVGLPDAGEGEGERETQCHAILCHAIP